MQTSPDVVKRWVNEAQEAVNSDNMMVQVSIFLSKIFLNFVIYFYT